MMKNDQIQGELQDSKGHHRKVKSYFLNEIVKKISYKRQLLKSMKRK